LLRIAVGAIAAFAVGFISHLWLTLDTETANAGSRAEAGSTSVSATIHPASRLTEAVAELASEESDNRSEPPPARSAFAERFSFDQPSPPNASSQRLYLTTSFDDRFVGDIPPALAPVASAVAAPVAPPEATPRVAAVPVPAARPASKRSSKSGFQLASASDTPVSLAYAPSDPKMPASPFNSLTPKDSVSPADVDTSRTAIYDITSRTVYLPNGRRLEAHSGLGGHMDNPRSVHLRATGPTPPNVYELKLREQLFHGVRAIRLIPTDRSKMYGRDGILAHSYMLGPSGQSNGCVSFKDYAAFLDAFDRGEITRLVVVERLDNPPSPKTPADWLANTLRGIFRQS
jgi:Protein of unknown function (DUF2778)